MKHENLFKIHIPEPCHEDWNKMTPNQQGAFCKVCAKTVIDFSSKSEDEIQKFLLDNADNKICGRFRISQLENNNHEEIPRLKIEKPKFEFPGYLLPVMTPFRAYAMAVMLFASVALQSCGNSDGAGGDDTKLAGTIEMVEDSSKYEYNNTRLQGGVSIKQSREINNIKDSTCGTDIDVVGKMQYNPPVDTIKTDTTETMLKGEIAPQKTHGVIKKAQPDENEDKDYLKGLMMKNE